MATLRGFFAGAFEQFKCQWLGWLQVVCAYSRLTALTTSSTASTSIAEGTSVKMMTLLEWFNWMKSRDHLRLLSFLPFAFGPGAVTSSVNVFKVRSADDNDWVLSYLQLEVVSAFYSLPLSWYRQPECSPPASSFFLWLPSRLKPPWSRALAPSSTAKRHTQSYHRSLFAFLHHD